MSCIEELLSSVAHDIEDVDTIDFGADIGGVDISIVFTDDDDDEWDFDFDSLLGGFGYRNEVARFFLN